MIPNKVARFLWPTVYIYSYIFVELGFAIIIEKHNMLLLLSWQCRGIMWSSLFIYLFVSCDSSENFVVDPYRLHLLLVLEIIKNL